MNEIDKLNKAKKKLEKAKEDKIHAEGVLANIKNDLKKKYDIDDIDDLSDLIDEKEDELSELDDQIKTNIDKLEKEYPELMR